MSGYSVVVQGGSSSTGAGAGGWNYSYAALLNRTAGAPYEGTAARRRALSWPPFVPVRTIFKLQLYKSGIGVRYYNSLYSRNSY